ncbi:MAG TPA: radical SAM protein, partial [Phycisphaerae bacterium]|nr:radical SAM protein [Phycisphaerae bacterium]
MRHIFGPVPSRRLGRSLGVDLVPFKTCTYDCIYCQLGRTTHKTVERREWVPLDDVLAELKEKLAARPDYITLSGSGEPTLY